MASGNSNCRVSINAVLYWCLMQSLKSGQQSPPGNSVTTCEEVATDGTCHVRLADYTPLYHYRNSFRARIVRQGEEDCIRSCTIEWRLSGSPPLRFEICPAESATAAEGKLDIKEYVVVECRQTEADMLEKQVRGARKLTSLIVVHGRGAKPAWAQSSSSCKGYSQVQFLSTWPDKLLLHNQGKLCIAKPSCLISCTNLTVYRFQVPDIVASKLSIQNCNPCSLRLARLWHVRIMPDSFGLHLVLMACRQSCQCWAIEPRWSETPVHILIYQAMG